MRAAFTFKLWYSSLKTAERFVFMAGVAAFGLLILHAAWGFWFLIPLRGVSYLLVVPVTTAGLVLGLFLLLQCSQAERCRLKFRLPSLLWLAVCCAVFLWANPYFQGARLRFWLQGGERPYLRFAADTRAKFPPELPAPPENPDLGWYQSRMQIEEERARVFQGSLERRLLDHHPTSWDGAGVQKLMVSLSAGSGLTGSWGIDIFDQAELPAKPTEAELEINPYLRRYQPFSARVCSRPAIELNNCAPSTASAA